MKFQIRRSLAAAALAAFALVPISYVSGAHADVVAGPMARHAAPSDIVAGPMARTVAPFDIVAGPMATAHQ